MANTNRIEATAAALAVFNTIDIAALQEECLDDLDVIAENIANILICDGFDGELALDVAVDVLAEEICS